MCFRQLVSCPCSLLGRRKRLFCLQSAFPAEKVQRFWAEKVSQLCSSPLASPVLNQRTLCADEPWVKESGVT